MINSNKLNKKNLAKLLTKVRQDLIQGVKVIKKYNKIIDNLNIQLNNEEIKKSKNVELIEKLKKSIAEATSEVNKLNGGIQNIGSTVGESLEIFNKLASCKDLAKIINVPLKNIIEINKLCENNISFIDLVFVYGIEDTSCSTDMIVNEKTPFFIALKHLYINKAITDPEVNEYVYAYTQQLSPEQRGLKHISKLYNQ